MSFERIPDNIDYIASLSNRPNDQEGMTATELKRRFDQGVADIKEYINLVLLPALEADGADTLGIEEISGVDVEDEESGERRPAATVQEALVALKEAINSAAIGDIPDGSLTAAKFAERSVTAAILALLSVGTIHLQQKAVTGEKIADAAIETRSYKGRSVTGPVIALASILNEHLGSKVVRQTNMADGSVGTDQLIDGNVTYVKTSGIQKEIYTFSGTLTVAGWNNKAQALTIQGMTATCKFVASPDNDTGWAAAADAMLYPPTAGANTLTFTCDSVPAADIPVTVYWWEA